MFHHLESKHQEQDFRFVIDRLGSFYEKHRHCIDPAEISQIVEVVLLACKDGFHHLDNTTDILNDNITDRWDLPSSFFFSATVVTTIGIYFVVVNEQLVRIAHAEVSYLQCTNNPKTCKTTGSSPGHVLKRFIV